MRQGVFARFGASRSLIYWMRLAVTSEAGYRKNILEELRSERARIEEAIL